MDKKFHITITDNETGEKVVDCDTCAIIAGIDEGEYSRGLCLTNCNGVTLAGTAASAEETVEKVKKENPEVAELVDAYLSARPSKAEKKPRSIKNIFKRR